MSEERSAPRSGRKKRLREWPITPSQAKIAEHRGWLKLIHDLIEEAINDLPNAPKEDDRVGRAAYLGIISQVFETIQRARRAISLEKLTRISRIIAEQRRAEVSMRKQDAEARGTRAGQSKTVSQIGAEGYQLPAYFREMVRQLYGVSLEDSESSASSGTTGESELEKKGSEAGA